MPQISVIVPVYNVEKYLHRCINSILAQTFTDFELILVNDGSPDNCPYICDEYAKIDERVRVIHKNNEGVSKARNDGVQYSKGQYIAFIDSDDWIDENYLSSLYDNIINYNADISVVMINHPQYYYESTGETVVLNGIDAMNYFGKLNDVRFRGPVCKLIKKDIILKNPFPTDRTYAEDMAVVYKWYYNANTVVGVDTALYNYFINENGATFQPYSKHHLGKLKTLNEMVSFFENHNFKGLYVQFLSGYIEDLIHQRDSLKKLNEIKIARKLNKEIHTILLTKPRFCIKNYPHHCNTIFPKTMSIYWIYKSIINKFKAILGINHA